MVKIGQLSLRDFTSVNIYMYMLEIAYNEFY